MKNPRSRREHWRNRRLAARRRLSRRRRSRVSSGSILKVFVPVFLVTAVVTYGVFKRLSSLEHLEGSPAVQNASQPKEVTRKFPTSPEPVANARAVSPKAARRQVAETRNNHGEVREGEVSGSGLGEAAAANESLKKAKMYLRNARKSYGEAVLQRTPRSLAEAASELQDANDILSKLPREHSGVKELRHQSAQLKIDILKSTGFTDYTNRVSR